MKRNTRTSKSLELLESVSCFVCLSPSTKESLLESMVEQSFTKGELIILEGELCPGVFLVRSGAVSLYRASSDGVEQIVRIVHRGECFECAAVFDNGPNPTSAQALEATNLYLIPAETFRSVLGTEPQALLTILPILSARLRSLLSMVDDFSFLSVYSRLAKLLYQLGEWQEETLVVSPSLLLNQQHLACMLGCSRQAVNNSLRKLASKKIIRMERRRVIILKPEALRETIYPEIIRR